MRRQQLCTNIGIILVAVNMRLPITAIPPIMGELQRATGLSATVAGLLTSIPLLTFALVSTGFTQLGRRWGNEIVLSGAFILLSLGSALRILPNAVILLLGTFLIGVGIDGGNVILPAIIKQRMPERPTLGVSLYTTSMVLMSSLATAVVGFLVAKWTLSGTLIGLFGLSLISLIGCGLLLGTTPVAGTIKAAADTGNSRSVWSDGLAWWIALFFGLQALLYYSLVTWLPTIFVSVGYQATTAAMLVTILQLACLVCAFVTPWFAASKGGKRAMLWAIGLGFGLGPLGILGLPHGMVTGIVLALLMGIASGFSFNLAVIFFTQKTANAVQTIEVSGMAQTVGYLLAASGPFTFGLLHGATNNWTPTLLICLGLAILITAVGLRIERQERIFSKNK